MSKNSLDLGYMKDAIKVKSGVRAGATALYMIRPFVIPYRIINPLYGIDE